MLVHLVNGGGEDAHDAKADEEGHDGQDERAAQHTVNNINNIIRDVVSFAGLVSSGIDLQWGVASGGLVGRYGRDGQNDPT